MLSTVILFLFQSFLLALVAAGIGMQLYDVLDRVTRFAHLSSLHAAIHESASAFLIVSAIVWLLAETNLVRTLLTAASREKAARGDWFSTFAPLLFFLGAAIALLFIGGAGLFVAGVAHIVLSEELSCALGLLASLSIIGWLVYVVRSPPTHGPRSAQK